MVLPVGDERAKARQRALLRLAVEYRERYETILNEERHALGLPPRRPRGARPADWPVIDASAEELDRVDSKRSFPTPSISS